MTTTKNKPSTTKVPGKKTKFFDETTPPAIAWVFALLGIIGVVILFVVVMGGIVYTALKMTGV